MRKFFSRALKIFGIVLIISFVLLLLLPIGLFISDDISFQKLVKDVPKESLYNDTFNVAYYTDISSICNEVPYDGFEISSSNYTNSTGNNSFGGKETIYFVNLKPTGVISKNEFITSDSYCRFGEDDRFIFGFDPDFGNYWVDIYINNSYKLPNENDKIKSAKTETGIVIDFSDKQIKEISKLADTLNLNVNEYNGSEWSVKNGKTECYELWLEFEGHNDISVFPCHIIKSTDNNWYICNVHYIENGVVASNNPIKLPQDISDTINNAIK